MKIKITFVINRHVHRKRTWSAATACGVALWWITIATMSLAPTSARAAESASFVLDSQTVNAGGGAPAASAHFLLEENSVTWVAQPLASTHYQIVAGYSPSSSSSSLSSSSSSATSIAAPPPAGGHRGTGSRQAPKTAVSARKIAPAPSAPTRPAAPSATEEEELTEAKESRSERQTLREKAGISQFFLSPRSFREAGGVFHSTVESFGRIIQENVTHYRLRGWTNFRAALLGEGSDDTGITLTLPASVLGLLSVVIEGGVLLTMFILRRRLRRAACRSRRHP